MGHPGLPEASLGATGGRWWVHGGGRWGQAGTPQQAAALPAAEGLGRDMVVAGRGDILWIYLGIWEFWCIFAVFLIFGYGTA